MIMTGRLLSPVIFIIMLSRVLHYFFILHNHILAIIFIFAFFAGNTFLPTLSELWNFTFSLYAEPGTDLSFEEFCKKFEVSPRETDVVREICNGLSNQGNI